MAIRIRIPTTRRDYIILDGSNIGLNIHMRTNVIYDVSPNEFLEESYPNQYKNRIILSQRLETKGDQTAFIRSCLITQNNIKNNIKFIHESNSKLLFIKNQDTSDNSYNYLLTYAANVENRTRFFHLNYYFNNLINKKDYFNFKIKDYIYKDICSNNAVNTNTNFKITDFSSNPIYSIFSNNISLINYKSFDFSSLFIDDNTSSTSSTSINKLINDISYNIYNNIYSYNKLTLDFNNVNTYTFTLHNDNNSTINLYNNNDYSIINTINTFMIKTNNFNILNNIKANSNIIFNKNNIFLNNIKAIDVSSNFYSNNPNYKKSTDLSNTIFLSLGKQITGITQYDLYKHTHIYSKSIAVFDISKIVFRKDINASLITSTNTKYNTLLPYCSNLYLLDFIFYYSSNNIINNANNYNYAINYNNVILNRIEYRNSKVFDLQLAKIIDFSYVTNSGENYYNNNYYINNLNNLLLINNKNNITTISYGSLNNALRFKPKNINYDNNIYKLDNKEQLSSDLLTSIIRYDARYNYDKTFYLSHNLDILLDNNTISLSNDLYPFNYIYSTLNNSALNFYSLQFVSLITTTIGSDFENVDCIYIYHNPATETDPRFLYPNNNIEIITNSAIDTLEKAIVLLPSENNSRINNVFIPARNGSNLSRKMIQGLVGLNNVPKLLSIIPYDTNVITGRGFINQYQIEQSCKSEEEQIKNKINSIKHYSVKDTRSNLSSSIANTNFANIVRSSALNRVSQSCVDNLNRSSASIQTFNTNNPIITPIKEYRKMFYRK